MNYVVLSLSYMDPTGFLLAGVCKTLREDVWCVGNSQITSRGNRIATDNQPNQMRFEPRDFEMVFVQKALRIPRFPHESTIPLRVNAAI